ncbi:RING-variant domain is a C4HC3 zinc-finger like motif [Teratosphaeria destructans]|uniref:RING-type E3 ubiquitin transferase n=1 Tax=Teratosphaeria destructans TaxID=418781 RepID=A0A9W7SQ56_9PEZI|nr:RING-variant domain is a C4HC3 zinc-finger like motif [Teratosphaeria destructans]
MSEKMTDEAPEHGAALKGPLDSHPPDPEMTTISRRNTTSSVAGASDKQDICRICRSEGTDDEPLFYPCKCSGSMKYVHQDCLMEWLSHSHKKHCELCKTPFRFTKLYDAQMPDQLPWGVFVQRAFVHVIMVLGRAIRGTLVASVWLLVLPWLVRWAWRWMFWVADAGWAREAFMSHLKTISLKSQLTGINETDFMIHGKQFQLPTAWVSNHTATRHMNTTGPLLYKYAKDVVLKNLGMDHLLSAPGNTSAATMDMSWGQPDESLLSGWTYLSQLTSSSLANRMILDVFEGQLITCVVITGFILVFLIREWVVQQQPLVNLDGLANAQNQLREVAERVQAENDRLQRQQEILEQARERLIELQAGTSLGRPEFVGLDGVLEMIDHATEHLRDTDSEAGERFLRSAGEVLQQIRAAGRGDGGVLDELTQRLATKLASLELVHRQRWEDLLLTEIEKSGRRRRRAQNGWLPQDASSEQSEQLRVGEPESVRRPPMPDRDYSSRATQIQRLLEEAEGIFNSADAVRAQATSSSDSDSGSLTSAPASSTESWQEIASSTANHAQGPSKPLNGPEKDANDEVPIANAGPDAKINIKRSGKGKVKPVPPPQEITEADKQKRKEVDEAMKKLEEEIKAEDATGESDGSAESNEPGTRQSINPSPPDRPESRTEQVNDTLSNRVVSAFREEFGFDEAGEPENLRPPGLEPDGETAPNDGHSEGQIQRAVDEPASRLQRIVDWFWGDIVPDNAPAPVPAANEERIAGNDAPRADTLVAPFVNGGTGAVDAAATETQQPNAQHDHAPADEHVHDPEVVAAAQAAGLDAEAVEDAEDLEGIFELVGFQGPLIGLFQTSTFCTVLVTGTVFGAVGLPYIWGKLVLSFLGGPMFFLVKLPLQIASFVADFVIDTSLFLGSWVVFAAACAANLALAAAKPYVALLADLRSSYWLADFAFGTATKAGQRLAMLFVNDANPTVEGESLAWNMAFLSASTHAHASLRLLQDECDATLNWLGHGITSLVDGISGGSPGSTWQQIWSSLAHVPSAFLTLWSGVSDYQRYLQPLLSSLGVFRTTGGSFTLSMPRPVIDPSLIYWSSTDRFLAVSAGYLSLAAIAAIYVAIDQPITRSESGRKTEKMVRDTLRQAGGVLKVILIISIEMLAFPLYCGLLLDLAFLPLFQGSSVASRWAFAAGRPYLFCFMHWFIGTCYMFHFALFVGMCRKILRRGVLWFIRDPDDPTFHPVRDVLERNVATQLRKIAFSALVYGALVILCLGGVIWSIGKVFNGIFPIHWVSTEPILEFPLDLLLYNAVTPLVIRLFKPSDAVNAMYAWWLRRCARVLRLSHFLFDDRRKDEEGHSVRKSWSGLLLMRAPDGESGKVEEKRVPTVLVGDGEQPDVGFERDGKYVLTPCNDQYRPPKAGEAFLHYADDDGDVYIADKDGNKNDHFAKVYVPPNFRLRITLFMVCLWIFSAFTGLCATLLPLCFGRRLFASFMPTGTRVNDIYAYSVGAYILGGLLFAFLQGRNVAKAMHEKTPHIDLRAWVARIKSATIRTLKCLYVYGFIGLVLPTVFALAIQFYLVVPLHTYLVSVETASNVTSAAAATATPTSPAINATTTHLIPPAADHTPASPLPALAHHTIHILQDYCLGLLYLRLTTRFILTAPTSKAPKPSAASPRTATSTRTSDSRPVTSSSPRSSSPSRCSSCPPLCASVAIRVAVWQLGILGVEDRTWALTEAVEVAAYRFSYPLAAGLVLVGVGTRGVGKMVEGWRARVRDEVYLVGERLHNFGERKPPAGSRSVVRKG